MSHTDEPRRLTPTPVLDPSVTADPNTGWVSRVLGPLQYQLWFIAVSAMVADIILTVYGLGLGLTEVNPVAIRAMELFGYAGLGLLKGVALTIGVVCWAFTPREYAPVVPLGLATPSVIAVCINTALILYVS